MAVQIIAHRGNEALYDVPRADLAGLLADASAVVWIDVSGQAEEDQAFVKDALSLHPLVVEDMFGERAYPKVEDFGDYLYIVVHGIDPRADTPHDLETVELDVIVGARFVLTHHCDELRSIASMDADVRRNSRLLQRGAAFVAHALLDRLTDLYLPVVDRFDDAVDRLEDRVISNPTPDCLEDILALKRSLQKLRRVATHQKEILHRLSRGEFELIPENALPFYRDIYDHFVRVADLAESYRDLVSATFDAYLSIQSQRLNEVMKMLTMISTIMLPLTFIAGVYGMNFEFMPELRWRYGYPFALGLMAVVGVGLYAYFKKKRLI